VRFEIETNFPEYLSVSPQAGYPGLLRHQRALSARLRPRRYPLPRGGWRGDAV